MDGKRPGGVKRRGQMHGAAIGTDDERGTPQDGVQLQQIGPVAPFLDIGGKVIRQIPTPDHHDPKAGGTAGEGSHQSGIETLPPSPRKGMDNEIGIGHAESGGHPPLGQDEFRSLRLRDPEMIQHREIS